MAVRRLHTEQPATFAFSRENLAWAKEQIAKYPEGRQASAVIPLLWRAQEQDGWVSEPAIRAVADMLEMPYIRVLEVATFYTMFHLAPVGRKAHVQVCGTTPCMLCGAGDLISVCKKRIAEHPHEVSADGDFSWEEVECLGACVNAPMVQIFADTYEDLTAESFEKILDRFAEGGTPAPGPQVDRLYSAPEGGLTALIDAPGAKAKGKAATSLKETAKEESPTTRKAAKQNLSRPEPLDRPESEATRISKGKPEGLDAARHGKADDLKRISGVGPKIEGLLHGLGIFHFDQIAAWTPENVAWVDGYLKFKGRIDREDWISQAKAFATDGKKGG